MKRTGVLICLLGATAAAANDTFMVNARVLRVEPLTEVSHVRTIDPGCLGERPPHSAGLAALLAWDLGVGECARREQVTEVTGYRVHYEWNQRVYSDVMDTRPADYVPIRISVD